MHVGLRSLCGSGCVLDCAHCVACMGAGWTAMQIPEVAFTGDTSGELFEQPGNADLYRAKLLIVELTFLDESVTVEQVCEGLETDAL